MAASGKFEPIEHHYYLDLLRFGAAISVFIFHYQHFFYNKQYQLRSDFIVESQPFFNLLHTFYHRGSLAVQIFWMLSGYVISLNYLTSKRGGREFLVNRIARLYPLHLAALSIVCLLQLISTRVLGYPQIYKDNTIPNLVLNIFFLNGWPAGDSLSFNAPSWSVSIEILLYLIFAVLFLMNFRYKKSKVLTLLVIIALVSTLRNSDVFQCGLYFVSGLLIQKFSKGFSKLGWICVPILVLQSIVLFFAKLPHNLNFVITNSFLYLFLLSFFSIFVWLDARFPLRGSKLKLFVKYLGNLTYGIYLLHIPLQIFLIVLVEKNNFEISSFALSNSFFILNFSLIIIIAQISYFKFELPVQKLIRKKFLH